MPAMSSLKVSSSFDAQQGTPVPVSEGIVRLTAPNASAYTFTGTNSFVIGTGCEIAVLDPGPDDDSHLDALVELISNRQVTAILLTHTHRDHSALAPKLATRTGAPIWFGGQHRLSRPKRFFEINPLAKSCHWDLVPDRNLFDGDVLNFGDIGLKVVATPGHCANHLAFAVEDSDLLFSGDHVMGWNSTLVSVPDGSMRDYFSSLDKLLALPHTHYLPAHGGPLTAAKPFAEKLRAHRQMRNTQILNVLKTAPMHAGDLRARMYPSLPIQNHGAALMTIQAHLEYLAEENKILAMGPIWRKRYGLA